MRFPSRMLLAALVAGVLIATLPSDASRSSDSASPPPPAPDIVRTRMPRWFEPNHGQAPDRVEFLFRARGYTALLDGRGAHFVLRGSEHRRAVVRMAFSGSLPAAEVGGRGRLPGVSNFFHGNDPDRWITHVPQYRDAAVRNLYDGVELRWRTSARGGLAYDLEIAAIQSRSALKRIATIN